MIFTYMFAYTFLGLPAVVVSIVLAVSPDNYGLITTGKVSINRPDELWVKDRCFFLGGGGEEGGRSYEIAFLYRKSGEGKKAMGELWNSIALWYVMRFVVIAYIKALTLWPKKYFTKEAKMVCATNYSFISCLFYLISVSDSGWQIVLVF